MTAEGPRESGFRVGVRFGEGPPLWSGVFLGPDFSEMDRLVGEVGKVASTLSRSGLRFESVVQVFHPWASPEVAPGVEQFPPSAGSAQ